MIYGDNPNKINEREDALGLKAYTYVPNISAIVQSGNLYVYCGSNPVRFLDESGEFWESALDVISLCFSIAEVAANPYDPMNWIGLAGDVVDLVPFVTGVGETAKLVGVTMKFKKAGEVTDTIHIVKATEFTKDAQKIVDDLPHKKNWTVSEKRTGISIHSGYKTGYDKSSGLKKEYHFVDESGRTYRADFYDKNSKTIYELKPN